MNDVITDSSLLNYTTDFVTWITEMDKLVTFENMIGFLKAGMAPEINHLIIETKQVVGYMLKPVATLNGKLITADQNFKIVDIEDIREIYDGSIALYSIIAYDGFTAVRYAIID